jgi:FkbM family methyltransferase
LKTFLQSLLLRIYRCVQASGLLSTSWGRAVFEWAYDGYKSLIEAGEIHALADFVQPRSWLVDVGANIGFFTVRFARWVSEGGRVVAIEPEPMNFERLRHALRKRDLLDRVETIQGVAAESDGVLRLAVNPLHPADHRIASSGVEVKAVTLDRVLAAHGWPPVALIKIDVQGAEHRVLSGARETLRRLRPTILVEVDDQALRAMNASADAVLEFFAQAGYEPRRLNRRGTWEPVSATEVLARSRAGRYTDFLFEPTTQAGGRLA